MVYRILKRCTALVALVGILATAGVVDAAPRKKVAGGATVSGMVVHAKNGRGVGRARVKVAGHHHKHHHKKHVKGAKRHKGHAAHAGKHRGHAASAMTGPRGHFNLRGVGSATVTLVAHKRGAGTGHAKAAAGSAVTIRLHKHHHAHSGVITGHARHKVHARVARKNGGKQKGAAATPGVKKKAN